MPSLGEQLTDRESALVTDALTRRCKLCHAAKGDDCVSPINGKPLPDRIVHLVRTAP